MHSSQSKPLPENIGLLQSVAAITGQRDRDLLARTLIATLAELIKYSRISMYRIVSTEQEVEAIVIAQSHSTQKNQPTDHEVILLEDPHFKIAIDTGLSNFEQLDEKSCRTIYPVVLHGRTTVALLEIVAEQHTDADDHLISSFLRIYSNFLSVLDESETDTLTGLLNRRTFEKNLERIIAECASSDDQTITKPLSRRKSAPEQPHWLAVMDIDHFKRINDEFGHLYGDEVLLLLSRHMRRVFRLEDKLFRFGGEEFVVVLDRTDLNNARHVFERFRSAIEQYSFPQVGRVTISIGFVRLDKADGTSSIVGRADQALYYAKEHGRNMVSFYEDLVAEGNLAAEHYSGEAELF